METKTKIDSILAAIGKDIKHHEDTADKAMMKLELLKISSEEYKEANKTYGINLYISCYLRHVEDHIAKNRDIKEAENIMRFHSYQQKSKGALDDGDFISLGQAAVAVTLGDYVNRFFA